MLKDLKSSDQTHTKIVIREVLAGVGSLLLFPFGIKGSKKRTARLAEQRSVVFVHGYIGNRSSFLPLFVYLRLVGVKQILSFNYPPNSGVDEAAMALRDFLKARVRGGRIDLVCHSLGGVIARVYLQELGGARRVDRCITLGTPHQGTYNAYWIPSSVGRDLRPDSTLIERLERSRNKAAKVTFTSIVADSDNIILPRVFAVNGEDIIHIPNVGHLGMLFSIEVFRAVAERLLSKEIKK